MAPARLLLRLAASSLVVVACAGGAGAPTSPAAASAPAATVVASGSTVPATIAPAEGPTACDHPNYPLRTGATWTTNNGPGQTIPSTITNVTGDSKQAIAKLQSTNPSGSTFTADILCGPGLAYGDAVYVGTDGKQGTRKRTGGSGMFLPPAEELVDGRTFSWTMVGAFDMPSYDGSGKFFGQIQYTVELSQDCTVSGPKSVTLATGAQTGFQVTCTGTRKSTDASGKVVVTPSPINLYYLKGIGPSGVDPGTELVSYSIP